MAAPPTPLVFALMLGVTLAVALGHALDRRRRRARLREMEERMDALFEQLRARAEGEPPTTRGVLAGWRHLRAREERSRQHEDTS